MKSLANSKKLKERILAKHNYDFFNSTKCVEKFGTHMGRRRTWKSNKWVFKRKGFLHHGTQKSLRYVWMERFSQCIHFVFVNHNLGKVTNLFLFRGKHWCFAKKKESLQESEFSFEGQVTKSSPTPVDDQLFPGDLDRGTPLVIKENNRNTIIGKGLCMTPLLTQGCLVKQHKA